MKGKERHKEWINLTCGPNALFSSSSSSISKYISDFVIDIVPLTTAPGATSLHCVETATGPAEHK